MSLEINLNRTDQHIKVSGLSDIDYKINITIGANGGPDSGDGGWLIRLGYANVFGDRIDSIAGDKSYIYGNTTLQIDAGTVYSSSVVPSNATIFPLMVNGAVVKIENFTPTGGIFTLFGLYNDTLGMHFDVSQIEIRLQSDNTLVATFDTSTPAAQYTNNGITLDIVNYSSPDTTAPVLTPTPTAGTATANGHTITATADENCTIYAVMLADGATAPSADQVIAGQDGNGTAGLQARNGAATANVSLDLLAFNAGAASTAYDYYVTAQDATGNKTTPILINATTNSGTFAITGGTLTYGAAFTFTYSGMASVASPIVIGPDSQGKSLNVTVNDLGGGNGNGTMPALPSSGSSSLILIEDNLTVTATEV